MEHAVAPARGRRSGVIQTKRAQRIGTFDISIRPFDDCCSLFVPLHPETRAELNFTRRQEDLLDVKALVDAAVAGTEIWRVATDDLRLVNVSSDIENGLDTGSQEQPPRDATASPEAPACLTGDDLIT